MQEKTISVVILSYNVEDTLEEAIQEVLKAVKRYKDYEIIISDGGSTDNSINIANKISSKNKKIKIIQNKNIEIGQSYLAGLNISSMVYFTMFPGDNENSGDDFTKTLEEIDDTDIIIPYTINQEVRPFYRRIISYAFTIFMNKIFNLNLKYYNGTCVYKTNILKQIKINSKGFAYSAEILIKLLKLGYSYKEVGIKIKPSEKTTVFKIKGIINVLKTIIYLFYEINMKDKSIYTNHLIST